MRRYSNRGGSSRYDWAESRRPPPPRYRLSPEPPSRGPPDPYYEDYWDTPPRRPWDGPRRRDPWIDEPRGSIPWDEPQREPRSQDIGPWRDREDRSSDWGKVPVQRFDYKHGKSPLLSNPTEEQLSNKSDQSRTMNPIPFHSSTIRQEHSTNYNQKQTRRFNVSPFRGSRPYRRKQTQHDTSYSDFIPMEPKGSSLYCDICNITMTSIEQLQLHLVGGKHLKELNKRGLRDDIGTSLTNPSTSENNVKSTTTNVTTPNTLNVSSSSTATISAISSASNEQNLVYCKVCHDACQRDSLIQHVSTDLHLLGEQEWKRRGQMIPTFKNLFSETLDRAKSEVKIVLGPSEIGDKSEYTYPLYCEMCNVHSESYKEFKGHLLGKRHMKMTEVKKPHQAKAETPLHCSTCNVTMSNMKEYDIHFRSQTHAWNTLSKLDNALIKDNEQSMKPFTCQVCRVSFSSNEELTHHFISKEHVDKINPPRNQNNSSVTSIKMATDFILSSKAPPTPPSPSIVPYTGSPVSTLSSTTTVAHGLPLFQQHSVPAVTTAISYPYPLFSTSIAPPSNVPVQTSIPPTYTPNYMHTSASVAGYPVNPWSQWTQAHGTWTQPQTTWTQPQTMWTQTQTSWAHPQTTWSWSQPTSTPQTTWYQQPQVQYNTYQWTYPAAIGYPMVTNAPAAAPWNQTWPPQNKQ